MSFSITNTEPFFSSANTVSVLAATTSPTGVALDPSNSPRSTVVVTNRGDVDVFVAFGTSTGVTATPSTGYPILARSKETLRLPPGVTHATAATDVSGLTAPVLFTVGFGA